MNLLKIGKVTKNIRQWSDISGINKATISERLRQGRSPVEAVFYPTRATYDVYSKSTGDLLVASEPVDKAAEILGVSPATIMYYVSRPGTGRYEVIRSDITGEEIYNDMLEEGEIV